MRLTMRCSFIGVRILLGASFGASVSAFAPVTKSGTFSAGNEPVISTTALDSDGSSRDMTQTGFVHEDPSHAKRIKRDQSSFLSAVAIGDTAMYDPVLEIESLWSTVQPVLSTALLITGNTVGASCLVLPEIAAKPGFSTSAVLFLGAYLANLVSGLLIAEVAIKHHDASGKDVPSSFKEFADANLDIPIAGTIIAGISLFLNTCIMSFDLTRAGQVMSELSGSMVEPFVMTLGVGALLAGLATTQSAKNLSTIASIAVTALFVSLVALLLPGLANVQDPLAVLMTPGTSTNFISGVQEAAPIILMACVYQNIVPSVTKILNYDRAKTIAALVLGSAMPLCMFLALCFASIGGGIDPGVGAAGLVLTAFSLSAVSGSSIGTVMSLSEELDSFFTGPSTTQQKGADEGYSLPSVLVSVAAPLAAAAFFAGGDTGTAALQVAGAYGTPLLYGAVPVAMAWTQRHRLPREDLVPGGAASLGGLGVGTMAFLGNEVFHDVATALSGLC